MRRSLIAASTAVVVGTALATASAASAASLEPTITSSYSSAQGLVAIAYDTILANNQQAANKTPNFAEITPTAALQTFIGQDGQISSGTQISTDVTPAFAAAVWATLSGDGFTAGSNADLAAGDTFGSVASSFYQGGGEPASLQQMSGVAGKSGLSALLATSSNVTAANSDAIDEAVAGITALAPVVALSSDDPADFPFGLFSVDGDVYLSSAATVTAIDKPTAYTVNMSMVPGDPSYGYVLPQAFTLTFPADFNVNTALVAAEIQPSQVANPPAANAIGTASITSPAIAALVPGSHGADSTATVYAVANTNPSLITQPSFEVYLGSGDYILGTLAGVTFPLTVSFSEPYVGGTQVALPVSKFSMTFPATTSPLEATSCTDLGALTGTMTDAASAIATQAGDTADSGAVPMSSSNTVVTNQCVATVATPKVKNVAVAIGAGLKGPHPIIRVKVKTAKAFRTVKIGLPRGLRFTKAKAKILRKEVRGSRIRSVRIAHGKLVIRLRRAVTSETIQTRRPLIYETAGLIKSIKRHRTKKLTLHVKAGRASMKVRFRA